MSKASIGKFSYVQDWGTYPMSTLIAVGLNKDEIHTAWLEHGLCLKFAKWFKETANPESYAPGTSNYYGMCVTNSGKSIIWFQDWKDEWEDLNTLVHELSHLILRSLVQRYGMEDETEAQAYQTEYMFHHIRLKLHNELKRINVTKGTSKRARRTAGGGARNQSGKVQSSKPAIKAAR